MIKTENMEIITYGNECPPFSKCWCEKHPNGNNHPNCQEALPLGNVYLDILLVVSVCVFVFQRMRLSKNIT